MENHAEESSCWVVAVMKDSSKSFPHTFTVQIKLPPTIHPAVEPWLQHIIISSLAVKWSIAPPPSSGPLRLLFLSQHSTHLSAAVKDVLNHNSRSFQVCFWQLDQMKLKRGCSRNKLIKGNEWPEFCHTWLWISRLAFLPFFQWLKRYRIIIPN